MLLFLFPNSINRILPLHSVVWLNDLTNLKRFQSIVEHRMVQKCVRYVCLWLFGFIRNLLSIRNYVYRFYAQTEKDI